MLESCFSVCNLGIFIHSFICLLPPYMRCFTRYTVCGKKTRSYNKKYWNIKLIENNCFGNESLVTIHIRNSSPNNLILVLWAHHTQARQTLNSGCSTGSWPYCCTSLITHGSVLGSKKKVVTASLSPCRADSTG